jgi:mannose-1-phosphate guanylyltransferase
MLHESAVVLAGGSGTRFWPLSRARRPKQVLPILGAPSLVRRTVDRLAPLFPPERVWCVTSREQADLVRRELPSLAPDRVVEEPEGRDTAAAVGLAATILEAQDPEAAFVVLPADHFVDDPSKFQDALRRALDAARDGALVTLGIPPRHPATGFGYLHRGERAGDAWRVRRFTEKPPPETARRFVEGGEHFWNAGIFAWKASALLAEIGRHLPLHAEGLRRIRAAVGTPRFGEVLAAEYPRLPRISIDFGVMVHASNVLMVEAPFEWDDVGSWAAAAARRPSDAAGNAVEGPCAAVGCRDSLVISTDPGHVVGVLGLEGMVVVHTPDATLVCPKGRSDDLKALVEELRRQGRDAVL